MCNSKFEYEICVLCLDNIQTSFLSDFDSPVSQINLMTSALHLKYEIIKFYNVNVTCYLLSSIRQLRLFSLHLIIYLRTVPSLVLTPPKENKHSPHTHGVRFTVVLLCKLIQKNSTKQFYSINSSRQRAR